MVTLACGSLLLGGLSVQSWTMLFGQSLVLGGHHQQCSGRLAKRPSGPTQLRFAIFGEETYKIPFLVFAMDWAVFGERIL